MSREIIYDQWLPFKHYHKHECDIKLKDGTIIYHTNPNAGFFVVVCGKTFHRLKPIPQSEVSEIMYRRYYQTNLCNGDCNGKKEDKKS